MRSPIAKLTKILLPALLVQQGPVWAQQSEDTLRIAWSTELSSYDPYYTSTRAIWVFAHHVWDTLIYRDPVTSEYMPSLASSYTWIDDVTLELSLRENITFHNGEAFNADDVVFTLESITAPDAGLINPQMTDWIRGVEKIDDYTVRILMDEPFPPALEFLSNVVPIYPNEYYAEVGPTGMSANPVGTGPYKVESADPGKSFVLVRNEDYFEGSPKAAASIGRITQRTIPDPQTQVAELLSGNLDFIWNVPSDIADRISTMDGIEVKGGQTMRFSYLRPDTAGVSGTPYFTDVRVRRAVAHAVDREALATNLMGEGAEVARSVCFPTQLGCATDVRQYEYDPEKARALLAEAGYPDGFEVELYAHRNRPIVEAIIGYLADVGIRANLNYMQFTAAKERDLQGLIPIRHGTHGSNNINDVSILMRAWFQGVEEDHVKDPEIVEWNNEAGLIVDAERRKELYSKVLNKVAEQAYMIPLHTYVTMYAYTSDLQFTPFPDELPRFNRASWKQ